MGRIKGWKLNYDNPRHISWTSIKKKDVDVMWTGSGWTFFVNDEKKIFPSTKKIAINIALQYMRSHPNG